MKVERLIDCELCPKAKKKKTKSGYEYLITPVEVCGAECIVKQGEKARNALKMNYQPEGNSRKRRK
ncbi:hypothetical protein SCACP_30390 [Sporomusa carbonis]